MADCPFNYVWTSKELRASRAFRELTKTAILVLMDFHGMKQLFHAKRSKSYSVTNNGELVYTYAMAESRGISRSAFLRALDELIEKGFLTVAEQGGGLMGHASKYALSSEWRKYGYPDFSVAGRQKRRPLYKGHGFQPGHKYYPPGSRNS